MGQPSVPALHAVGNRSVAMARKIADTKKMTHDEWVQLRKSSLGGSDAAVCVNMNTYSSLLTLYADKMGLSSEKEQTEAMRLGNDLEEYVAKRFTEKTGKKVRNDFFMYADDEYDYITANIDRRVVGENAGLECKTMGNFNGYNLEAGEIPSHYYCQCQHYMMVMGFDRVYLAILVLQRDIYVIPVERDDDFIKSLREAETAFWTQYVMQDRMPEPDGSDSSFETLKELYPKGYRDTEISIPGLDRLVTDYKSLKEIADDYGRQAERVKAQICARLGKAEVGVGLQYGCSWKTQSKTSVDAKRLKAEFPDAYAKCLKVSDYRVFRTKTLKEKKS